MRARAEVGVCVTHEAHMRIWATKGASALISSSDLSGDSVLSLLEPRSISPRPFQECAFCTPARTGSVFPLTS